MTALLWLLPLACGHAAPRPGRQPNLVAARFTLDISDRRVATRDDLRADFVITNTGSVALWLNGRMILGESTSASPFHEVWVEAQGPGPITWWCYLHTPAVQPKHYRVLAPGESAGRKPSGPSADLRCLGLDAPGTYRLLAHYRDGNEPENVPPAPPASVYLGWELVSEPVTVEITRGSARGATERSEPRR